MYSGILWLRIQACFNSIDKYTEIIIFDLAVDEMYAFCSYFIVYKTFKVTTDISNNNSYKTKLHFVI